MSENSENPDESDGGWSPLVGEPATGDPPGGMPTHVERVDDEAWATVVRSVPIVSVDLVVLTQDGDLVLGRRENEPAKGEWFVPGGRVQKGERVREAVHRIAREELGVEVGIETRLGTYEHFWATGDTPEAGGKHYVPIAFRVRVKAGDPTAGDDQHGEVRAFEAPPKDLHPYVERYLRDAGVS